MTAEPFLNWALVCGKWLAMAEVRDVMLTCVIGLPLSCFQLRRTLTWPSCFVSCWSRPSPVPHQPVLTLHFCPFVFVLPCDFCLNFFFYFPVSLLWCIAFSPATSCLLCFFSVAPSCLSSPVLFQLSVFFCLLSWAAETLKSIDHERQKHETHNGDKITAWERTRYFSLSLFGC